jgi:quinol monooxygenase YgiN
MVIVAGHLMVEPDRREGYLASCVTVVQQARRTRGCLDFAISADLVDPARINILERWDSHAVVEAFRGEGTSDEQSAAIVSAFVAEYDVADVRQLSPRQTVDRSIPCHITKKLSCLMNHSLRSSSVISAS